MEYYLPLALTKLGHEVCIFTSDRYYPVKDYYNSWGKILGKRIVGKGLRTERGVKVNRLACLFEFHSFCILGGLIPALEKFKPDVIQVNSIISNISCWFIARSKEKLTNCLVCDEHVSQFNTSFVKNLWKRIYFTYFFPSFIKPTIIKEFDKLVAIGQDENIFLANILGIERSQIQTIELGVDIDLFKFNITNRTKIRKNLKIQETDFVIFFSGYMRPSKKIHILLEAVSRLYSEFSSIKLFLVGGGDIEYVKYLKNLSRNKNIEKCVFWLGYKENQNIPQYISAADIGCWPGDPAISVQEVISVGLPIILEKETERTKSLLFYDNGFAVKVDDVDELVMALRVIIENPELRKIKGEKSRHLAEEHLSWTNIAQKYLNLYDSILSENGNN